MRWSARQCGALYHSNGAGFSLRSDAYIEVRSTLSECLTPLTICCKSLRTVGSPRAQQPLGLGWASPRGAFTCADTFRAMSIQLPLYSCKGACGMMYWYLCKVGTGKR